MPAFADGEAWVDMSALACFAAAAAAARSSGPKVVAIFTIIISLNKYNKLVNTYQAGICGNQVSFLGKREIKRVKPHSCLGF